MAVPTPLRENSCPRPPPAPEGVVISEVASAHWTNHSQQKAYVELHGPPMTDLQGLVLSVFDQEHSGTVISLPLTGSVDQDGFYVIGNVTGAGEGNGRPGYRRMITVINETFLHLTLHLFVVLCFYFNFSYFYSHCPPSPHFSPA